MEEPIKYYVISEEELKDYSIKYKNEVADVSKDFYDWFKNVLEENTALKKQLSEQKYLNRDEVLRNVERVVIDQTGKYTVYELINMAVTAICSLAYMPTTRNRIIEILERHGVMGAKILASEILEGKEGEDESK